MMKGKNLGQYFRTQKGRGFAASAHCYCPQKKMVKTRELLKVQLCFNRIKSSLVLIKVFSNTAVVISFL